MEIRRRLLQKADSLRADIEAVSRFVHAHPEEGFQERESSRFLAGALADLGFRVEKPLPKLPTAFRASWRGRRPGPGVGFIAEYDCLPGIGHGCGHNLIAASAFGAAAALAPFLKELGGSIWVFGTPAEEYGSGKVPMLEAGVFRPAQAILMAHPESFWLVDTRCLALDAFKFEFHGRSTHAAATPWEDRNALDAVIQLFNGVSALRQQLRPDVRVHGIISKGGRAPNVIPELTEAQFYVRAHKRRDLDAVSAKVKDCARAGALAAGCTLKIVESEPPLDDMVNNPVLARLLEKNLRAAGVRELAAEDTAPGSADIGNVSHRLPTVYFYFAAAPAGMDLHTAEFARQAVSGLAHEGLMAAVKAMALTGLEILQKPGLAAKARLALKR